MEGNFRLARIQEHLETGRYFNNVNLDGLLITKLYDDRYETLWIDVYDNSITFEEFQNDLPDSGGTVSLLRCCIEYFVRHLDHEFIFYDMAEYDKRQSEAWQKAMPGKE